MGVGILKIVRAAEVVLGSRAADGGILGVPVQVELNLPFAPPTVVVHAPRHVSTYILSLAFYPVQDGVLLLIGKRVHPTELGVEIGGVFRDFSQTIIHLIVADYFRLGAIL